MLWIKVFFRNGGKSENKLQGILLCGSKLSACSFFISSFLGILEMEKISRRK